MKKRNFLFLAISFLTISAMAVSPSGVVINGVTWATCNVDAPGTFAATPEAFGMFYQWNSKVGWPASGAMGSITATDGSTTWNKNWNGGFTTPTASDTWAAASDPSPVGYRVPTKSEIQSLYNATYVTSEWITQNGVTGRKFTDKATGNFIFIPASGGRNYSNGSVNSATTRGLYWTSTADGDSYAYFLDYGISSVSYSSITRASFYPVRSVVSSSTPVYNAKNSVLKINSTNGKAEILGLPQGASVVVYNLQGITIYNQKVTAETISIELPARGVYIVNVDNESVKIVY